MLEFNQRHSLISTILIIEIKQIIQTKKLFTSQCGGKYSQTFHFSEFGDELEVHLKLITFFYYK